MKRKSKATIILLTMLLLSGCSGCVLVLRDYFAPMFSNSEGSVVLNIETYIDGKNQPTHLLSLIWGKNGMVFAIGWLILRILMQMVERKTLALVLQTTCSTGKPRMVYIIQ